MNRLDDFFAAARRQKQTAFLAFVTAGDPDWAVTHALVEGLSRRAADLGVPIAFEIGFPYSDPIADGAVIQASYTRVLDRGLRIDGIFQNVQPLRRRLAAPLVAMVSYSLVFRATPQAFLDRLADAGFDGLIVPDLPVEEAADVFAAAGDRGLRFIQLIAPTTPAKRIERVLECCSGFVYLVSVTGITGARASVPSDVFERVAMIRKITDLPVAVGFGISKPEHVAALTGRVDGVIVGSAIVRLLEGCTTATVGGVIDRVVELLRPLTPTSERPRP